MKLIANPAAGGGRVGREWETIRDTLRSVFPDLQLVRTTATGHATELAVRAIDDEQHTELLSLGGDGTHSEVAAGIAASKAAPGTIAFGALHGGTGGDFSRLLGRGELLDQALRLRDGPRAAIDLGRVRWDGGERVFLNEVSFGMSAAVCANVNNSGKRLGGKATFLIQTLRTLATYRPQPVEITVDGETFTPGPIQTALFCNGRWAGGGMQFAPNALLDDAALDLTVIRDPSTLRALRSAPALYNGRLLDQPHVSGHRGAEFAIRSLGEPLWIEADGEVLGHTPATIEVMPAALVLLGAPLTALGPDSG